MTVSAFLAGALVLWEDMTKMEREPLKPAAALSESIAGRSMLLRWERIAALSGTRSASRPYPMQHAQLLAKMYQALYSLE